MAKLFALEDGESTSDVVEMEAPVEAGEVASVETEMAPEVTEIEGMDTAITEGEAAAGQLEEVQEVVESSLAEGGEEGLSPVAAEAIRLAIEAISARVGYNPKSVYALYATENFSSASSRKANTKIALEGVGEFLKDLWKKIKAAVSKMWEKVVAFWNKHLSNLGRAKKALESMKAKVSASTGTPQKGFIEEGPSSLASAFQTDEISAASVTKIIDAHKEFTAEVGKINADAVTTAISANKLTATAKDDEEAIKTSFNTDAATIFAGLTKSKVLVNGKTIYVEVDGAELKLEHKDGEAKFEKAGVKVADKAALGSVIAAALAVINDTIKLKDKSATVKKAIDQAYGKVDAAINAITATESENADSLKARQKTARIAMRSFNKISTITAVVMTDVVSMNVKLTGAVLSYASLCLKQFKS